MAMQATVKNSSPAYYILAALMYLLVATPAGAQEIFSLYSGDIGNCEAPGLNNLFSGFVCTYQSIVDAILSSLYIAMLNFFQQPFFATLTLFVICVGVTFGMGLLPFTTKDIMLALAKIAILTGFAMYPSLMIDLLYNGLIGFIRQTVDITVATLSDKGSVAGIFVWMDKVLYDFLSLQDTARKDKNCNSDVLALLFGLAVTMPPVFAIALYILFQFIMVFVRAVLGYLLAITGIMFLTTLAPLFFGFALFSTTRSYFDKWLSYLLGWAVQIFVVFAFIAVVLSLPFDAKLKGVLETIQPYDKTAFHDGQRLDFDKWCTLCMSTALGDPNRADICKGSGQIISPTNTQVGGIGELIDWIGQELIILAVMAYLAETILKAAPNVAKFLTNVPYAPGLGGKLPMPDRIGRAGTASFRAFRDTSGGAQRRGSKAVSDAISQLVGGR
jgi:TrbL/VirB6 plasmid conjugal transfer protein